MLKENNKYIIIPMLSDGKPSMNEGILFEAVAAVHAAGISVYTVGLGTGINEAHLKQVSSSPQVKDETYWVVGDFQAVSSQWSSYVGHPCAFNPFVFTRCIVLQSVVVPCTIYAIKCSILGYILCF